MITFGKKHFRWIAILALCSVHSGILSWHACIHSPTIDELGHLPSGVMNWSGRFDAYRVNPPLVRMVAAIPLVFSGEKYDLYTTESQGEFRSEWPLAYELFTALKQRVIVYFAAGRILCIPFSLLGLVVCWRWSSELQGPGAGMVAGSLWCFSPCILGHGALLTPDVAATSSGVLFFYCFWKWLVGPSFSQTMWLSVALTLCFLSKFTWMALLPWFIPLISAVYFGLGRRSLQGFTRSTAMCLGITLYFVNAMYGFSGTGHSLVQISPVSQSFRGWANIDWIGSMPLPFPKDLLLGIDQQRMDFENKMWSYLLGEWRLGGWWHYYLVALFLKSPLGLWPLLVASLSKVNWGRWHQWSRDRFFLTIVCPPIAIIGLVSSQTGFNHHLRYILPAYPFLFILASCAVSQVWTSWKSMNSVVLSATIAFALSSLAVVPHSLSYFNESIGGPTRGHFYLGNSNIDWGQDALLLWNWTQRNPNIQLDGCELAYPISLLSGSGIPATPKPGWYAISVNSLHDRTGRFTYFLDLKPVERIGYSIHIYHIEP